MSFVWLTKYDTAERLNSFLLKTNNDKKQVEGKVIVAIILLYYIAEIYFFSLFSLSFFDFW